MMARSTKRRAARLGSTLVLATVGRRALVVLLAVAGGLRDFVKEDDALELSAAELGDEALDRVQPSKARTP